MKIVGNRWLRHEFQISKLPNACSEDEQMGDYV
jgi:hypothetical protein